MNDLNTLFDKIYKHRVWLSWYFVSATLCALLRTFVLAFIPVAIVGWTVYAIAFFPLLKLLVFKSKSPDVFSLLTQITIYIFCIAAVYVVNTLVSGVVWAVILNSQAAVGLGGLASELLCLFLMSKVVFKKI